MELPIDIKAKMEEIHNSLLNGQGRQAVDLIDQYGLYDVWEHYRQYLYALYTEEESRYNYFSSLVILYHRIKNR